MKSKVSLSAPGILRILDVLGKSSEPLHSDTIEDCAKLSRGTFSKCYRRVLLNAKKIHVAEWLRNTRGPFIALYALGKGPDAPKPQRVSDREVSRRWKERTGYNALRVAKARLIRPADPILAALMGIPAKGKHFKEHHNKAGVAGRKEQAAA